MGRLIRKRV